MTTAKEALLKAGRISAITRGRISKDNHAWLAEQVKAGTKFSDYPKSAAAVATVKDKAPNVKVEVSESDNYGEIVIFYPRDQFKAVGPGGKVYGMAEVCNTCRVSLVQNHCDHPTILTDIPVKIVSL